MKPHNFVQLATFGFLLSLVGSAAIHYLNQWMPSYYSFCVTIAGLGQIYSGYLILNSATKTGRLTSLVIHLVMNAILLAAFPSVFALIAVNLGFIWLARLCYFHKQNRYALFDAFISALGLLVACWVLEETQSWLLSLWCFFLSQALLALLSTQKSSLSFDDTAGTPGFKRASHNARQAIAQLTQ